MSKRERDGNSRPTESEKACHSDDSKEDMVELNPLKSLEEYLPPDLSGLVGKYVGVVVEYTPPIKTRASDVCFSPCGGLLASASWDGTVRVWCVDSGESLQELHGHSRWVSSVCFSPSGRLLASASSDGTVRLWLKL